MGQGLKVFQQTFTKHTLGLVCLSCAVGEDGETLDLVLVSSVVLENVEGKVSKN